nr:MAG TPA: hypothetical protein [Caudoviricetes sp.]
MTSRRAYSCFFILINWNIIVSYFGFICKYLFKPHNTRT